MWSLISAGKLFCGYPNLAWATPPMCALSVRAFFGKLRRVKCTYTRFGGHLFSFLSLERYHLRGLIDANYQCRSFAFFPQGPILSREG